MAYNPIILNKGSDIAMKFDSYKSSVAVYLRKSRMDPDDESVDETLARHSETLMQMANRMDLTITGVYKEVVSGDGLFTRPEMVRLLKDIENGRYSAVACMEIDRLGRSSQKDGGIILETFQENNVCIITPAKVYDLNDEIDEQSVEMQTFIARQELKAIRRRLRKGIEKTVEGGCHVGEPPYGYRRVYIDKKPTLAICEEEAAVIRMVFDMYVNQGFGSHTIADELNRMGYTPRKNTFFSRSTIRFYLQNPVYTGKIVWNKHHHLKKKTVADKNRSVLNPEEKWIVADGLHPAIISNELFEEAQRIRLTRTHPPSFTGELKNPFSGLLYCKNCGVAIVRQFSPRGGERLLCPTTACTRGIQFRYVERRLKQILEQIAAECSYPAETQLHTENIKRTDFIRKAIDASQKELASLYKQKSSLHDFLEKGVYDIPTFLERANILSERITHTEEIISQKLEQLHDLEEMPPIREAIPIVKRLLDGYETLQAADKNALYKQLIKKMTYAHLPEQDRDEFTLDIEWRYVI